MQLPWNRTTEIDLLDEAITRVHKLMQEAKPTDPEYAAMVDQISKLYALKDDAKSSKNRVSPDTLAMIGANLTGILLVLHYEQANALTKKAFGMVARSIK